MAQGCCALVAALSWSTAAGAQTTESVGGQTSPPHDVASPQSAEQHDYPSLHIAGFGDIDFSQTKHPEGPRGFSLGQFVLHMTSELSPRVTFFGEISFTARSDAGTGTPAATGFNAEIERMILRFDESDRLKVSFGRYHTPINYWNTAFHHGQWLQTTILRPEMIQFGGRFLPVHFVGALVEGAVPARRLERQLSRRDSATAGAASSAARATPATTTTFARTLLTGFSKPDRFYGFQFGGSVYFDKITLRRHAGLRRADRRRLCRVPEGDA